MVKKSTTIKVLAMLVLICVAALTVISCDIIKTGTTNNNGNNSVGEDVPLGTEGLIFNSQTQLKVIFADYDYYQAALSDFAAAIDENLGERVILMYSDDADVYDHEIVIGESDREISKKAYAYLERLMEGKTSDYGGYVLYSDGASLALAYTEELGDHHITAIMDYLASCAEKTSMVAKQGVISSDIFDMYEIYGKEDEARQEEAFALLAQMTSEEVAEAVRTFYNSLYSRDDTKDIISWLANLYEPRKCVCENYVDGVRVCLHPVGSDGKDLCSNGGFYYSNSARNTAGFLPDIESTNQALELLEKTGMLANYGNDYGKFISGQVRADIVAFTKGLQDSSGYFYHPQWTKEESNKNWERVSRDLMWSVSILSTFNEKPYYNTPSGELTGTGGRPQTDTALTAQLNTSSVTAVSYITSTATNLPEHLQSVRAFQTYLDGMDLTQYGSGYAAANELAAQVNQLTAANRQIGGDQIKTTLFNWIEATHRADNGLWEELKEFTNSSGQRVHTHYDALNAAFKLMMVYSAFGMPFPYAEEALNSAIEVLSSDADPGHVCGTYNTWYDIAGLIGNIRRYVSAERADELQARVIEIAPAAIKQTIINTGRFICEDGSFSYFEKNTSDTSQGMLVAPKKIKEGDINASIICTGGIVEHIGQALAVEMPPIYGTRELAQFMDIICENGFSLKDALPPDEPLTFDTENVGNIPSSIGIATGSGGSGLIAVDPKDKDNQVLEFISFEKSGTWDALTITNNSVGFKNNCLVFDGKFLFESEGTSAGYIGQFYVGGSMGKDTAYFIKFIIAGKEVQIWESSSDDDSKGRQRILGSAPLDDWFSLRVEYYLGYEDAENGLTAHDTVRIKVYINETLVAVSSNYMDNTMLKFTQEGGGVPFDGKDTGALFYVMSYCKAHIYVDDLYLGHREIEYVNEKDTEGLVVNEDAVKEREAYDFEENKQPSGITISGTKTKFEFKNGVMNLKSSSGTGTLKFSAIQRESNPNVYAIGFDIKIDSVATALNGTVFTIKFKDPVKNTNLVTYTFKYAEIYGVPSLVPVYSGSNYLNSVAIPVGDDNTYHIELALFINKSTTLVYKGCNDAEPEMLASTEKNIAKNVFLYDPGTVEIAYSGKMVASIDNLFFESRKADFDEEVKPKVDRVVYDFDDGNISDIKTDGVAENGMLNLTGNKYISIPANLRSAYVSAYQLHTYIKTAQDAEETMYIKFVDKNGVTVAGLVVKVEEDKLNFYEMIKDNLVGQAIASVNYDGDADVILELYTNEKVLMAYVDDKIVLATVTFNGLECDDVTSAKISSSTATVDNIYLEGVTLTYTKPVIRKQTQDYTDEVITYEYSSFGNVPTRLTASSNVAQDVSIGYVERDGVLNKVLICEKYESGSTTGHIKYAFRDATAKTDMVFETDIKLEGYLIMGTWRSNFDVYFSNQTGGGHFYGIQFFVGGIDANGNYVETTNANAVKVNGAYELHLWANMIGAKNTAKQDCGIIPADDWFNIKMNVSCGDGTQHAVTGTKFTLTVNGKEIFTNSDFFGSNSSNKASQSSVYQIQILPSGASSGKIYLDNTKFEPVVK